jgi:hypothetical protein
MRGLIGAMMGLMVAAPAMAATPFWANPFNQKLMQLKGPDQYGALRRAITEYDQPCGRLVKGMYRGPYGNLGFWTARCKPGGDYGVFTGPDGSVQVRPCSQMKALKLPECGKLD